MKKIIFQLLLINILFSAVVFIYSNNLFAETYPTQLYKWQKIGYIDGNSDTSFFVYSKIQKSSNDKIALGGLGYFTQYPRSILISDDFGESWKNIFNKGSINTDYIIDSKDRLLIIGNRIDTANYIYLTDMITNQTEKITLVTEKQFVFSRIVEFSENKYLIKANDGNSNYLFLYNYLDSSLTQLLPRQGMFDSTDIAINKDLMIINDVALGEKEGRIIVTSLLGSNLYYTDDLYKTIHVAYKEDNQFNRFRQIILGKGRFIYSYAINDTSAKDPHTVGLYKYNETKNEKQLILNHYMNGSSAFNPISMMACSYDNYIVCKMGVTYALLKGYGDTLNVDSLMISDDYGDSFKYVPFPAVDSNYNYFAFAVPSVTNKGEIFLLVFMRKENGSPSPLLAEVYYGVPDDVRVKENSSKYPDLFPNPTSDKFTLSNIPDGAVSIEIFDIFGERVLYVETQNFVSLQNIDVSSLSTGVYFLKLNNQPPVKFIKL